MSSCEMLSLDTSRLLKTRCVISSFETPNLAFQKALGESKINDTILVTGSTYLFSQINLENN